jgi:hypothetical protein
MMKRVARTVMSFTGDIVPGGDTPSKKGSASTGVCVAIVGLGGLGAELLKRLIEARTWRGRRVTTVVAIDYFADAAAREAVSKSLSAVFSRSYVFSWDATKLQSTLDLEKDLTVALGTTTKVDALLITTGMGYHGSTRVTTLVQSDTALQKLLQVNCTGPSLLSQLFASKFMRAPPKGADWAAMSAGFESPVILLMSSYSGMVGTAPPSSHSTGSWKVSTPTCPTCVLSSSVRRPWTRPSATTGGNS